ncbi:MAG: glycosyltransferase [Phycisphaerae bacterium]|nr:glycosyltransferase [Phycisphaerae bacterium]
MKLVTGSSCSIVLAGGGTGGHISPGLAIAERLREIDPDCRAIFACSQRPVDASMLTDAREEFVPIPAEPFGLSPLRLLRCVRAGLKGRRASAKLLAESRASWVVSLGGFVTFPVVGAATSIGTKVLLVNLDATPGKANRWVAKRATNVLSAVPTPHLPSFAERIIGMPIRRAAIAPGDAASCRAGLSLDRDRRTLLVTGASQGASSLNDLLVDLVRRRPELLRDWQVYHLCGKSDRDKIAGAYDAAGVRARVEPFLHRMGLAWGAADAAISRAGANSVAEAACNAVPTLFAPYPYHKDLHQKHNAQPLVDEGCALMELDRIEATANRDGLGAALERLVTDDALRDGIRAKLVARPKPDAALEIARFVLGR